MGRLCKNVAYIRSTARNSSWSILQLLISCKSFLLRVSEQNKKDSERPTCRERRQEDGYRSPNHRLPWNGRWQEERWPGRTQRRDFDGRASVSERRILQEASHKTASRALTRHILVSSKTHKASCNSTSRSELPPSFIYGTLLNLSTASKEMEQDEMYELFELEIDTKILVSHTWRKENSWNT